MNTGTPMREKPSASTISVTVLPVPVAPATRPWRLPYWRAGGQAARPCRSGSDPCARGYTRAGAPVPRSRGHARVRAVSGTFYLTTPIYYVNARRTSATLTRRSSPTRCALPAAGRRRSVLAHRHRRARGQGRPGRAKGQDDAAGWPTQTQPSSAQAYDRLASLRRLYPHDRGAPQEGRPRDSPEALGRRRDLPGRVRRPLLLRLRAVLHRKKIVDGTWPDNSRCSPRSRRRTTSFGCRNIRAG